jgi:hypothetical protein
MEEWKNYTAKSQNKNVLLTQRRVGLKGEITITKCKSCSHHIYMHKDEYEKHFIPCIECNCKKFEMVLIG